MREALAVVTAVAPETRAVLRAFHRPTRITMSGFRAWRGTVGSRPVTLVQSGIGPHRAREAFEALDGSYALVVSAGFAGALVANAAVGDVVLPKSIVWDAGSHLERYAVPVKAWSAARAALPADLAARVLSGPMLSSSAVIASVSGKRAAASRFAAIAVEMEAAGLVAAARERNVEVLVVRTILDQADVSLEGIPLNLDSSWRARARLVRMPQAWPRVAALARQVPHAGRTLAAATAVVIAAV